MRNLFLDHQVNPDLHQLSSYLLFFILTGMKIKDEVVYHIYVSALTFISPYIHIKLIKIPKNSSRTLSYPMGLMPFNRSLSIASV